MKRLIIIFVTIIFVFLFIGIVAELSAQIPKSPNKHSESSSFKSSNPYSVLMQKFANPATPPTISPESSSSKSKAKTQSKSKSDYSNSESIELMTPYDSGRNIFLKPIDTLTDRYGQKTRQQILKEKEKKENDSSYRAKGIIEEYEKDQQSYDEDKAKLIAIEKATSVTKKTDSPSGMIASSHKVMSDANYDKSQSNTDTLITQWEREVAKLMQSEPTDDNLAKIESFSLRIERRKQFLARQAEALQGADIFMMSPSLRLSKSFLDDGWCNLFDGKTLFGWRIQDAGFYGGGRFNVEHGEICSDPYHPGLLYTTNQFGDSTLMFEFCADKDAELFLLYRTSPNPRDLNTSCYTVVLNSSDVKRPRGTILGRVKLGNEQIRSIKKSAPSSDDGVEGDSNEVWQRVRFNCDAGSISCTIDNQMPTFLMDTNPIGRGYVGFLVTRGNVRFRNINWRPGTSISLFDGIEIDSIWRYRRDKITPTAVSSTMQIRGGPGVIETLETFSDFVLQFEYRITNISGKAGLFFRSNPREEMTGYELSLQAFPTRKDRDEIVGVDVGSFTGRMDGRYVGAEDMQWNYVTLSAVDRQFQSWVNGIPVCEMSDRSRAPKMITVVKAKDTVDGKEILEYAQPASDEFHAEGTIQFHLPTDNTNIDIRNIRITKIAPRNPKKQTFEDYKKTTWKSKIKEMEQIKKENKLDEQMRENKK
ncbi:MAG: DUF1080 domain-containing protein [Planctomycetaceae bacterium]|jgi:hypothetical protein|nr:DUF1080 domain-containing protein [Planctomycetaceae bacterium]